MSQWQDEEEGAAEPRDWSDVKRYALIGAGFAGVVVAWMIFARPGEETQSTRGFNLGAESGSTPSTGKAFSPRPKTGLDMVSSEIGDGPESVKPANFLGSQDPVASAPAPAAPAGQAPAAAPPAQTAAPAPAPPAAPPSPQADAKAMSAAGVPTDAAGLNRLGAQSGMLSALADKLLDHPQVLKAVFNNKQVVDAFFSRAGVKENCQSGGALKSYLSDSGSGGMNSVLPILQKAMSSGAATGLVSALGDTEMVKRASACPSIQELSKDPTAVMTIAMANPKALSVVMDPRGAAALASNPQATSALAAVQSKMGGAQ